MQYLKCPKCGYTTSKLIGDVINPSDFKCPKCGEYMQQTTDPITAVVDKIKSVFDLKGS